MSTQSQITKFVATVVQNLPEMSTAVMQRWIENPVALGETLKEVLLRPWFKAWKTVTLGTDLKTAEDFRKAINVCGMRISDWVSDILGKPAFTVADKKIEIDLVVLTTAQLTGKTKTSSTTREVFVGAQRLGLEKCPAEVGPRLRLQYKDQPRDEWLTIGMEPIAGSDLRLRVFIVEHSPDGRCLNALYCDPWDIWSPDDRWVFCPPRK